jgi:hypothetical protein
VHATATGERRAPRRTVDERTPRRATDRRAPRGRYSANELTCLRCGEKGDTEGAPTRRQGRFMYQVTSSQACYRVMHLYYLHEKLLISFPRAIAQGPSITPALHSTPSSISSPYHPSSCCLATSSPSDFLPPFPRSLVPPSLLLSCAPLSCPCTL